MAIKPICSIDGCDKHQYARSWCKKHYSRWWHHGDPNYIAMAEIGQPQKYFTEVVLNFTGNECLIWPFGKSTAGYGVINFNGRAFTVHRLACEHRNGQPPEQSLEAAHFCGNRPCCNPAHIRWATAKENAADKLRHGTQVRGEAVNTNKLTEAQVLEIRKIGKSVQYSKTAAYYGVSKHTIRSIVKGSRWGYLFN